MHEASVDRASQRGSLGRGLAMARGLATVSGLGESEYSLRLVPFLAGVIALILFRQLAVRALPGLGGLVAVALFAVGEPLVYWSAEAKQYSLDVLAAGALLYIASEPLLTGRLTGRRAAVLAAVGALARHG